MNVRRAAGGAAMAIVLAALTAGAATAIGVDGAHALVLGWVVLAVVLVLRSTRGAGEPDDVTPPDPPTGGRRDVDQLAWSMVEHKTHIRTIVLTRVGAIATARLAEHGLDLHRADDAAAIEALLGPAAWAVLRPDRDRPVLPRALDATLLALERLRAPVPLGPAATTEPDRTSRAD